MPRPKRRCRGGRVTPKGTRPGDRPHESPVDSPPLEELMMQDAADAVTGCTDLDDAEVWASSAQMLFRPSSLARSPVLEASRVLAAAEACSDRTAAAVVAAAMGAYGPPGHRNRARGLLKALAEDGAPLPGWACALGDVAPHRAVLLTDSWGDERTVWIDFERPDGEVRGVGVSVNGVQGARACHFVYGPPIEALAGPFEGQQHAVLREISLVDARAMAVAALEMRDFTDIDYEDDDRLDDELRALIDQRIALLPEGQCQPEWPTFEEFDSLCGEFLAMFDEASADDAETMAETVCRFACAWCDADPLCWSPRRVALLLSVWIPAKSVCDDEWHDAVESVFPRWLRFAAERRGLTEDLLELNLQAARDAFGDMRANAADPTRRSPSTNIVTDMLEDGIDMDDEAAMQEWIERYNARPRHERY